MTTLRGDLWGMIECHVCHQWIDENHLGEHLVEDHGYTAVTRGNLTIYQRLAPAPSD